MARPDRPSFEDYFLGMAEAAAKRADCTRLQVGAVIVWGNRIWATGYNGPPVSGQPGCLQGACPRGEFTYDELSGYQQGNHDYSNCIAVHAEINAIHQFNQIRSSIREFVDEDRFFSPNIYTSQKPCRNCTNAILDAGLVYFYPGVVKT